MPDVPPPPPKILMESGDAILMETGDAILTEADSAPPPGSSGPAKRWVPSYYRRHRARAR